MHNQLNTIERHILFEIAKKHKKRIHSYTVYRKFRIPIHEVAKSVFNLKKGEYVTYEDDFLYLTPKAVKWISNSRMDFEDEIKRYWRKTPEEFQGIRISLNTPYVPDKKYLSNRLLITKENYGD